VTRAAAYAAQRIATRDRIAGGAIVAGRKIGLTSVAARQPFDAAEPVHGVLFGSMRRQSGETVALSQFMAPGVEVELAFVLKHDLHGPDCNIPAVLAATACFVPAIEIIDSRLAAPPRLDSVIAGNAGAAAFVLGTRKLNPARVDAGSIAAVLRRNGSVEGSGISGSVMGHPARAVAWLANDLAQSGQHLRRDDIILTGAFIGPVPVHPGDRVEASFRGFGQLSVAFA
jgi:2-oxo-hept-3-ene-1,7-dioate hydratase